MEPFRDDDLAGWHELLRRLRGIWGPRPDADEAAPAQPASDRSPQPRWRQPAVPRVLLGLLVVALALPTAPGGEIALAKKKHRKPTTVTRTFTEPETIIFLDEQRFAFPLPSTIEVRGFQQAKIVDVDLVLHRAFADQPDDLDLLLLAPDGRTAAIVLSDVGGTDAVEELTLTLDDQADDALPAAGPLASGRFRPTNVGTPDPNLDVLVPGFGSSPQVLATFNGRDPNGQWSLVVANDADPASHAKVLEGWALTITAKVKK